MPEKIVASIDIGEINLGCCILRKDSNTQCSVLSWELFTTKDINDDTDKRCTSIRKNGSICRAKASYNTSDVNVVACKNHSDTKQPIKKEKFKKTSLDMLAKGVKKSLDSFVMRNDEIFTRVTDLAIERQVSQNPTMISISMFVIFYFSNLFASRNQEVKVGLFSAKKKYAAFAKDQIVIESKYKDKKRQRKYITSEICRYLVDNPQSSKIKFTEEQREWVKNLKKKDDAADTLLQAWAYFMNKGSERLSEMKI